MTRMFPPGHFIHKLGHTAWIQSLFVVVLGFSFLKVLAYCLAKGSGKKTLFWSAAVVLAWVFMLPMLLQPSFNEAMIKRIVTEVPLFDGNPLDKIGRIFQNFVYTFQALFLGRGGVGNFNDTVFDLQATAAAVLGLVFFFVRPSWKFTFLLLAALAGMAAFYLSGQPHHARAMSATIPVLVFAAFGLYRLLDLFKAWFKPAAGAVLWTVLAVLFLAWEGKSNYDNLYLKWASGETGPVICAKQIINDSRSRKVFLSCPDGFVSGGTLEALCDGSPFHYLRDSFELTLFPGETLPDVEVLMSGRNTELRDKIRKQYPSAQFSEIKPKDWNVSDPPQLVIALIPGRDVTEEPGRIFKINRASPSHWKRNAYHPFGLGHGAIAWEECLSSPDAPFPPLDNVVYFTQGSFDAPVAGLYRFTMKEAHFAVLYVDGRKILDLRPGPRAKHGTAKIRLSAGPHRLSFHTFIGGHQTAPPEILVQAPGSSAPEKIATAFKPGSSAPGPSASL
jgi:hypothetical protein